MPEFNEKSLYLDILEFSKQSTALNLLESGVDANFFNVIMDTLSQGVSNGDNIHDLIDELEIFITGARSGTEAKTVGALQRYVTQVTNDSITQFNATYNQAITQDLGIEWYKYTGTKIATTREFCIHHMHKYYHKKEVELLGSGKELNGTNLSAAEKKGRIPGTNSSNIFINRGGYNCRHYFSALSARFVPKSVLKRNVKNGNWNPTEREIDRLLK